MRLIATRKSEQNEAALDPWTIVHLGTGVASGLMGVGFWSTLVGAVVYEIVEQQFEKTAFGQKFFKLSGPESTVNAVVDVGVYMAGWYMGRRWNRGGP